MTTKKWESNWYAEEAKAKKKIHNMSTKRLQEVRKGYGSDGKRWVSEELRSRGIYTRKKSSRKAPVDKFASLWGGF